LTLPRASQYFISEGIIKLDYNKIKRWQSLIAISLKKF